MQMKDLSMWKYDESMECMLFFAQRINELLFHHTTDTYRCSAVSLRGLAHEFCSVYNDSVKGIINSKNLIHIVDEFNSRLQKDSIAKDILTPEYVERFNKKHGNWDMKTQYQNIRYIGRKLSNFVYYNAIVYDLKKLIKENKQKKSINELSSLWVRETIDIGYNENYIYKILHKVFFHDDVTSLNSIDTFFDYFDFSVNEYDVYIGFSKNISAMKNLFEKIQVRESNILLLSSDEVPSGIKTKNQVSFLKFQAIKTFDMFSAYNIAYEIASCVVNSYGFFRHNPYNIKTYGQVVTNDRSITKISNKHLLKNRVSSLSQLNSEKNADALLVALFTNIKNQQDFNKIIKIHNAAICSESINDSLLSLWSILESLIEDNSIKESITSDSDNVGDFNHNRSKIVNIIDYILPFIKSTYIIKLVRTCMEDIIHWDEEFFNENILNNGFGLTNIERTFAFLTFESMQEARDKLYQKTKHYPLLRYRVAELYNQLHNSKHIKAMLAYHEQRVKWHMYRIYRARNYIVHDATGDEELNQELLFNLHSYIDITITKLVELINGSPYNDCIMDVLTEQKLEVSIFDERLNNQPKEIISAENAKRYLYYDYKK